MEAHLNFWLAVESLVKNHRLIIEHRRGSVHPLFPDYIYPLDCGYLEGCHSADGDGTDVFRGSLPDALVSALFISVDERNGGVQLKIALGTTEPENQLIYESLTKIGLPVWRLSPSMDASAWLKTRRSIRRFQNRKVERERIEQILDLTQWAPSAHNTQPWRFIVLENESSRQHLAEALGESFLQDLLREGIPIEEANKRVERSRQRIIQAPASILLCLAEEDIPQTARITQWEGERWLAVQSVALAGGQLMLAAHTLGLASVWLCAPLYAPQAARYALGLPDTWQPQALILLGYAAQTPPPPTRKPLHEIVRYI